MKKTTLITAIFLLICLLFSQNHENILGAQLVMAIGIIVSFTAIKLMSENDDEQLKE